MYFYQVNKKKKLNRGNRCARCGEHLEMGKSVRMSASYRAFLFCSACAEREKQADGIFFLVSASAVAALVVVYLWSLQE